MLQRLLITSVILIIASSTSQARHLRTVARAPECNVTMPCDFSSFQSPITGPRYERQSFIRQRSAMTDRVYNAYASARVGEEKVIGGRPAGCPSSFCGCGVALHVFGHIVPELNLAANWLRFPRTSPAPGMVAARRGHVFVLEQHLGGDMWMAYDPNSGGHATRLHARSLRGYTVVNPHAA